MTAAFARSAESSPFSKCTEELKTHVPEEVKEQFAALAVLNGKTSSEYLRDVVILHLYGQFSMTSMQVRGGRAEGR